MAVLLVCLASAGALPAQTPAVRFEHLSTESGMSHSAVYAIEQDRQGFLWFGTHHGLNRYDGYRFRVFLHDPEDPDSISANLVVAVVEDAQGELWVATAGGLDRFHRGEERFIHYRHDPQDPHSLSSNEIDTIFEDRNGRLWFATLNGLNRLESDGTFRRFMHDPANRQSLSDPRVLALEEDRQGRFWVGSYGGLDLFDPESATFRSYRHDPTDPHSLSHPIVNAIREDASGDLWIGTGQGLNRFDPRTGTFTPYRQGAVDLASERIFELYLDRTGELWVGTLNAGLIRIPPEPGLPTQYVHEEADPWSLSGDRIRTIFEDASGILWAGTWVGLNKYDRRREQFATYRREPGRADTLTDSNVAAVLEDRSGALWIGTWDKGLNRLDRQQGRVRQYQPDPEDPRSLPDDTVQALCEDRTGALWVATWSGLARMAPQGYDFTVYRPDPRDPSSLDSEAVMNVYEDRQGTIWVATLSGLSHFDPANDGFIRRPLVDDQEIAVDPLTEDSSGTLWIGAEGHGLFALVDGDATANPLNLRHDPTDTNSLASDAVTFLHADPAGSLWIATGDAGLDRLELDTRRFTHYREVDGLASDQVLSILQDDTGHLWLSTSNGLSRLDPQSGTFRNYGVEDGLQSTIFSYRSAFRSPSGEMFFGGAKGLNVFFPDHIRTDTFAPAVVLTDFQLFNRSVLPRRLDPESPLSVSIQASEVVRLSHRQDVFSLEFAALHYASPQKNRYQYRLEGFDDDWTTTGADRRLATYTNLDAGTYRFRVRGSNPNGVWGKKEATVRIVVAPPPWKSWWAYSLYVLATSAILLSAARGQRRKLAGERAAREKELEQERAVSRRLRQVDKLKDEFLANTSHELRTPLYGITGLAESLVDGSAGDLPEAARANLRLLVQSGRRLTALVNDILDFSKLRHQSLELERKPVDLHALVEVVLVLSRPLLGSKPLQLDNRVATDLPTVLADENRLQQILHNLVGNAIKFTESGTIGVSTRLEKGRAAGTPVSHEAGDEPARIIVSVCDNGIGIAPEQQTRIFEAFTQADASIERQFGGTGLGLAVSRQLVELHGGTLAVESTEGQGSTFFFDLPVAGEAATADTTLTAAAPVARPVPVATPANGSTTKEPA
ncbi:MAG: two-component regulator propeller domain-containing protein, partial [Acidobacteriota bacterium]